MSFSRPAKATMSWSSGPGADEQVTLIIEEAGQASAFMVGRTKTGWWVRAEDGITQVTLEGT